ncbi:hypothetical protein BU24DRAFT_3891 [Aaosphaeria arxii CBS 175.79]|uniref:Uncharacterized protein n=1 Tax=Aaosphaeria arxii CBS 175.79 TaxID=1450172 RepID=A0A6A5Y6G2_9PLEO|nr:uncharacterized protein BU24DRAFT_3891 [Aaosphaeria arxii CBS 175.79]KAF2020607.1 hypothetical protein BU24DRAFT_3891 [Aaosphaeria arxii CBS 175.79]
MVSTRHHPSEFPPPEASPTKSSSPRKSSRRSTASPAPEEIPTSSPTSLTKRAVSNAVASANGNGNARSVGWSHTASNITIAWVTVSMPLVIWDILYLLLRPHTMTGGMLQWPIWKPYEIYANVDYVYGQPGWDHKDGFGGAQAVLNLVEVIFYGLYIMIVYNHGKPAAGGRGLQVGVKGWLSGGVRIEGRKGNQALIMGFAAAVMTLSKTTLYYLNEYFSDFKNTWHNDWSHFIFLYIIMNGLWLAFPAYMTVVFGADILEGLDLATESSSAAAKKKY